MKVTNCRLCQTGQLSEPKLNLGKTPLANAFVKDKDEPQEEFPLEVCVCESCGHYQLNENVDPEVLFRHYLYVAGTSAVNVEHFRKYAVDMVERFELKPGISKVLDIASNDGTLLQQFKDLGISVLGIDPARNLAEEATKNGIPTIPEFFTEARADKMLKQHGQFHLITANNVMAHLQGQALSDFVKGVKKLLTPQGVFSFEISYWPAVVSGSAWDTIYHEHSSYHHITPLIDFFKDNGLSIFKVEHIPNHGGSVRVFIQLKENTLNGYEGWMTQDDWEVINNILQKEKNVGQQVEYLSEKIEDLELTLRKQLRELKNQGKSIAVYGFPAKATTLIYALGIKKEWIDFAVDDAPLKQYTYTPGMHIPVLPTSAIYEKKPDVLLVLAWNFADSIIANHKDYKGTWIVPLPELKVIKSQ